MTTLPSHYLVIEETKDIAFNSLNIIYK